MADYAGYPALHVVFDAHGGIGSDPVVPDAQASVDALIERAGSSPFDTVTDLVVVSHGWNNDATEATQLYRDIFTHIAAVDRAHTTAFRGTIGVLGIVWPSKRFDLPQSVEGAAAADDAVRTQLEAQLQTLIAGAATPAAEQRLHEAQAQLDNLDDPAAQARFVRALLNSFDFDTAPGAADDDGVSRAVASVDTTDDVAAASVLTRLMTPAAAPVDTDPMDPVGGAMGGVDGGALNIFGTIASTITGAALNLANLTTYATMKERAGIVGRVGLAPIIDRIRVARPALRIHLAGHSFGGRLVTAATAGLAPTHAVDSVTLLQAAYSHNGLAAAWDGTVGHDGLYRAVLDQNRVLGPISITHSRHDVANLWAYPLASRLQGQQTQGLGDANDPFGAMGANGAQHAAAQFDDLLPLGAPYPALTAKIRNLNGDGPGVTIKAHGDVAKPEIAYALLTALAH